MKNIFSLSILIAASITLSGCFLQNINTGTTTGENIGVCTIDSTSCLATGLQITTGTEKNIPDTVKDIQVITITAQSGSFSPSLIRISKGQPVTLKIEDIDTAYGAEIQEMTGVIYISKNEIKLNTTSTGTFSFTCAAPYTKKYPSMTGSIVIE